MEYKILIKYTSTLKKTFYYFYTNEDGKEYKTDDVEELKEIIKELNEKYGYENIKPVIDIHFDVNVNVTNSNGYDIVTEEETMNIYNTAYNEIFGDNE